MKHSTFILFATLLFLAGTPLLCNPLAGQSAMERAIELSTQTGRPILAVAGNTT